MDDIVPIRNTQLKPSGNNKMLITYRLLLSVVLTSVCIISSARQTIIDTEFSFVFTPFPHPHGSTVLIDSYHPSIFHNKSPGKVDTGIIDILQKDGFKANFLLQPLMENSLTTGTNIFAIIGMRNKRTRVLSENEIVALKRWINGGGSLLLVVGHYPNGEGAIELMKALGVEYLNGYANYPGLPGEKQDELCSHFAMSRENNLLTSHPVVAKNNPVMLPVNRVKFLCGGAVFRKPEDVILDMPAGTNIYYHNEDNGNLVLSEGSGQQLAGMIGFKYGKGRVVVAADQGIFRNLIKIFDSKRGYVTMNDPQADNAALFVNTMRWLAGLDQ